MTLLTQPRNLIGEAIASNAAWRALLEESHSRLHDFPAWYRPYNVDPTKITTGRVRIGLDLDGVFYDFVGALRGYLAEVHYFNPDRLPEPTTWSFHDSWGLNREEFVGLCDEATLAGWLFRWGRALPGARDGAMLLYAAGFELHIITARGFGGIESEKATREWLIREGIPHHSVTFTGDKTSVWTDYMLEDHLGNYDALAAAGTEAYLLNQPYNQPDDGHDDGRLRVDTVLEFAQAVITDVHDHLKATP